MNHTFSTMERWNMTRLRQCRQRLRDELSSEIQKRDALKAEIVYLQKEIARYVEE